MGTHERERNWKGGDAVLSCSITALDIKPLLRSKKSSYVESTLCVLKLNHVTNRFFFKSTIYYTERVGRPW